ncbi:hypothetical protein CWC22_002395 [Pseudoalteromonas rubra]|uniref:Uncharacterized protein n=1 Tax=Pseudoalteromonas rubra TaxID=43658 RepID=A0A5S3V375_9GAMM|nr:immunity 49 family protein [Pseudoalteromonas rubra]QPB81913.1 hypothetical protein CWC22_002395 [Pseudoalteromonas rubra]
MTQVHHYGSAKELDFYIERYRSYVRSAYFAKNAFIAHKTHLESMTGDSWEYSQAKDWESGFNFALHAQRHHNEARWFLRQAYNYRLVHFKRHLFPQQSHELRIEDVTINRPGERLSHGIHPSDWYDTIMLALAYNEGEALAWLDKFDKQAMDYDANARFIQPLQLAEFHIVKAILKPQSRDLVQTIQAYMQVDVSGGADKDAFYAHNHSLPKIDCLLSVFCHEDEQTYLQKMNDALDKFAASAKKADQDDDLFPDFALALLGPARLAYRNKGYLIPDHPYLPQWLITEDLHEMAPPPQPDSL